MVFTVRIGESRQNDEIIWVWRFFIMNERSKKLLPSMFKWNIMI